jgi:hypothetical protein
MFSFAAGEGTVSQVCWAVWNEAARSAAAGFGSEEAAGEEVEGDQLVVSGSWQKGWRKCD